MAIECSVPYYIYAHEIFKTQSLRNGVWLLPWQQFKSAEINLEVSFCPACPRDNSNPYRDWI